MLKHLSINLFLFIKNTKLTYIAVLLFLCFPVLFVSCDELEHKSKKQKFYISEPIIETADSADKTLKVSALVGKWKLDNEELKKEIRQNATNDKEAQRLIQEFDKLYKNIGMQFYDDRRYKLFVNDDEYVGFWELTSDKQSYNIQMAQDFIELHEVISIDHNKLVELPVARMRQENIPVKQMVFRREQ